MKYMLLFGGDPLAGEELPPAEVKRLEGAVMEWWGRHAQAGKIVGGERLESPAAATTVRFQGERPVVSDGPFVEAKESIGGFGLIDVADLDEALALAKTWPARGFVEIRPVMNMDHDH